MDAKDWFGMQFERFMRWAKGQEFMVKVFFGAILGSSVTIIITLIPGYQKFYALAFFLFFVVLICGFIWAGTLAYQYKEIEISKNVYSSITYQKWVNEITILDENGSAKGTIKRLLTISEGEQLPFITLDFWSESLGEAIKLLDTEVNGRKVTINPADITNRNTETDDGMLYKNLKVKIPVVYADGPVIELCCKLLYPSGAFRRTLDNNIDSIEVKIFHPSRFVDTYLKLSEDLVNKYRFDTPSFIVEDFNENRVVQIEELLRRRKEIPKIEARGLFWHITNPKVGLNYRLKFRNFRV